MVEKHSLGPIQWVGNFYKIDFYLIKYFAGGYNKIFIQVSKGGRD